MYDHSSSEDSSESNHQVINDIIAEAFPGDEEDTAAEAKRPELFMRMVHALRKLNYNELFSFYMGLDSGDQKSFALDAVPLLKTDAGVQFMREWLLSGELTQKEKDAWFATLTYYKSPTKLMIEVLTVLSCSELHSNPIINAYDVCVCV